MHVIQLWIKKNGGKICPHVSLSHTDTLSKARETTTTNAPILFRAPQWRSPREREKRERKSQIYMYTSACVLVFVCAEALLQNTDGDSSRAATEQQQSNNNKRPHTVIERVVGERVPPLPSSSLSSRQTFQLVFAFGHNTWRIICCCGRRAR